MILDFDAYVTAALFDAAGVPTFALGDGSVRLVSLEGFATLEAHDGAVLCACAHPSGQGIVTGGDDGRVVWSRLEGGEAVMSEIAVLKGKWIDAVAASPDSGLIAFAAGKTLEVRDSKDAAFTRSFAHEKSVPDIAFDPKGRRIAAATYGGAALWYARIEKQTPQMLKWAGSHMLVLWSPDGKFLLSSMQENSLHGWRLSDAKDMRMGGYPAKVKSLAFLSNGLMLATAGANGAVIWPFQGANGPMGKEAAEVAFDQDALVTRVAAAGRGNLLAGGLDDGRVWVCDLTSGRKEMLKAEKGAAISALAMSADGRSVAFGDEDGAAGVLASGF
ncbi:MAG: WD40 repeat domain-containing protein [Caulobacter sp.]|nr:WD40 repeat domain-containing protein [Caulobacter sp.]